MNRKAWKRKKDHKTVKQKNDLHWSAWWDKYPHYPHDCYSAFWIKPVIYEEIELLDGFKCKVVDKKLTKKGYTYRPPSYPEVPKRRKKEFHPLDYNLYGCCPKWWNKLFHIRPVRRKWKKYCVDASRLVDVGTYCNCYNWYDRTEGSHAMWWDDMDEELMCCECEDVDTVYAYEGLVEPSHKMHKYYW